MFRLEIVTAVPSIIGRTNSAVADLLRDAADAVEIAEAVYCNPSGEIVDWDMETVGWWKLTDDYDKGDRG